TEIDGDARRLVVTDDSAGTTSSIDFDFLHTVPPQSAPGWLKATPLADPDNPDGYVEIDKYTLQHTRYGTVFALGDAGSTPNSKTGAAIRKQAPVLVENLLAVMDEREPEARYDGYSSCPLTTARDKMLLAEFDYSMRPTPSFPGIDTTRERRDMWYLKLYWLPFMYCYLLLRGHACTRRSARRRVARRAPDLLSVRHWRTVRVAPRQGHALRRRNTPWGIASRCRRPLARRTPWNSIPPI